MFVPLPVPFVFQRTAPDLNAWRLKSPLALRSDPGKTFSVILATLATLHVGKTQSCIRAPPCHFTSRASRCRLSTWNREVLCWFTH